MVEEAERSASNIIVLGLGYGMVVQNIGPFDSFHIYAPSKGVTLTTYHLKDEEVFRGILTVDHMTYVEDDLNLYNTVLKGLSELYEDEVPSEKPLGYLDGLFEPVELAIGEEDEEGDSVDSLTLRGTRKSLRSTLASYKEILPGVTPSDPQGLVGAVVRYEKRLSKMEDRYRALDERVDGLRASLNTSEITAEDIKLHSQIRKLKDKQERIAEKGEKLQNKQDDYMHRVQDLLTDPSSKSLVFQHTTPKGERSAKDALVTVLTGKKTKTVRGPKKRKTLVAAP